PQVRGPPPAARRRADAPARARRNRRPTRDPPDRLPRRRRRARAGGAPGAAGPARGLRPARGAGVPPRGGGRPPRDRIRRAAVRAVRGAAAARDARLARHRRLRARPRAPPHRRRRLVDGGLRTRAGGALRGPARGTGAEAPSAARPVRRRRGLAARAAARRATRGAPRVLAQRPPWAADARPP